jgi:hypothetical protein
MPGATSAASTTRTTPAPTASPTYHSPSTAAPWPATKTPLYFERDDDSGRRVIPSPSTVTWRLAKTPFRDTRRASKRAGWRLVLELYPDAVLPEPPPKKPARRETFRIRDRPSLNPDLFETCNPQP